MEKRAAEAARADGSEGEVLNLKQTEIRLSALVMRGDDARQRRDASASSGSRIDEFYALVDEGRRRRARRRRMRARVSPSSPFAVSDASDASAFSLFARIAAERRAAPSAMARARPSPPPHESALVRTAYATKTVQDRAWAGVETRERRARRRRGHRDVDGGREQNAARRRVERRPARRAAVASACVRPFTRRRDAAMAAR